MQITIEDISPVEKRVELELPWTDVAPKLDKAYGALRRDVRVAGFRPGKVPRGILEKMYRQQVEEEVARTLVETSLGQAIQENQLEPVAPPTVDKLELKAGAPFRFSARVEVRSQVTPKDYSGVPLKRRPAKVSDAEVDAELEGYRRRLTEYQPVEGRAVTAAGDVILVDVSGRVGEHKLKHRTAAVDLDEEEGGPLPGLASRLRGIPIGTEPVEVKYTIAEDATQKELAGKPVDLRVIVKEARQKKVPALDDELAKDTGDAETLEGLRVKVRERLLEVDAQHVRAELAQQLVKEIIKRNDFPIARSLVDRHAQAMVARAKRQLQAAGIDAEAMDDGRMLADFRDSAEQEARGTILVQAIAEREGVAASDADVQKRIAELAAARNEAPKKLRADLEREQAMPQFEAQIREQKTLDMLISQAKITDADPATADEPTAKDDEKTTTKAEAKAEPKTKSAAKPKAPPKKKEPTP
ncbi:MAG TPA: trigger factor [Polyangia bacterium]|jgi:trigger factor|nr:trigger factor [Polyangia bacterium]